MAQEPERGGQDQERERSWEQERGLLATCDCGRDCDCDWDCRRDGDCACHRRGQDGR